MKEMDAGMRAWAVGYAKKNFWRVPEYLEFKDLLQFAEEAFYETRHRYPDAVEPAHVMSLFKLVYRSRIEDLARAATKQVDQAAGDIVAEDWRHFALQDFDTSELQIFSQQAPKEVRALLALMCKDEGREALRADPVRKDSGSRETLNERFCKLLGLDPSKVDVVRMTKDYFAPA
jgi:hypothetical protein